MRAVHFSLILAAVVLTAVCLIVPALQWASVPNATPIKWIAGIAALAVGICKIGFFPLAEWHFSQKQLIPAVLFGITGAVLMLLSVQSTNLFLADTFNQKQAVDNRHSEQRAALQKQIDQLNKSIDADLEAGYRKRALANIEKTAQLEVDKNHFQSGHQKKLTTKSGFYYQMITISLILHLTCIVSVLGVTRIGFQVVKQGAYDFDADAFEAMSPIELDDGLNDAQRDLKDRLLSGEFGQNPGIKNIVNQKVIVGGYPKVSAVFEQLIRERRMEKRGNSYTMK